MTLWLLYSVVGKLAIFFFQSFPLPEKLEKNKFIGKLHTCDLCFGFWAYSTLAFLMKVDLLTEFGFWYIPILSEIATGMATSFIMHLLTIGWREKFSTVII